MKVYIFLGIAFAAAAPFVPTEVQIWIMSAVAMCLAQVLRYVFFKVFKGDPKKFGRKGATVVLFVVAIGLAVFFAPIELPAWPGWPAIAGDADVAASALITWLGVFFGWLLSCLDAVKGLVGAAMVIYNLIGQKALDGLGIGSEQMKAQVKAARRGADHY